MKCPVCGDFDISNDGEGGFYCNNCGEDLYANEFGTLEYEGGYFYED